LSGAQNVAEAIFAVAPAKARAAPVMDGRRKKADNAHFPHRRIPP